MGRWITSNRFIWLFIVFNLVLLFVLLGIEKWLSDTCLFIFTLATGTNYHVSRSGSGIDDLGFFAGEKKSFILLRTSSQSYPPGNRTGGNVPKIPFTKKSPRVYWRLFELLPDDIKSPLPAETQEKKLTFTISRCQNKNVERQRSLETSFE